MIIQEVVGYTDGGTIEILAGSEETDDLRVYCIDRRLGSKTIGNLYMGYPQQDDSNLVPDENFAIRNELRKSLQGWKHPTQPLWTWDTSRAIDFAFPK